MDSVEPAVVPEAGSEEQQYLNGSAGDLLESFAAPKEVPGSGSANALTGALAAALVASVAAKTHQAPGTKYINFHDTARTTERKARRLMEQLKELAERDASGFANVIGIRRDTGKASDKIRQDASRRKEIEALKPMTELPIEIAALSVEVGTLAVRMLEVGFVPAAGEAYSALAEAISAADGALYVARVNIRTIKARIKTLNDPRLEAPWLRIVGKRIEAVRIACRSLRVREVRFRQASERELAKKGRKSPRASRRRKSN